MEKFSGVLGVITGYKLVNGISTPEVKEYQIYGDKLSSTVRSNAGDKINNNLSISNRFSFIASPSIISMFANSANAINSAYLTYYGIKLTVTDMSFDTLPTITVTTGEIWNE